MKIGGRLRFKPMLIEHYERDRQAAGRSPATVNREVACMKNMFNIAIRNGVAANSPLKHVKLLREDNQVTRVLSKGYEQQLLAAASDHVGA